MGISGLWCGVMRPNIECDAAPCQWQGRAGRPVARKLDGAVLHNMPSRGMLAWPIMPTFRA
jgi:hypothetical protein